MKTETPAPGPEENPPQTKPEDLFMPDAADFSDQIDWAAVEKSVRDFVSKNHPRLSLSDSEYERLTGAIARIREANLRMRSTERTSAKAGLFKQSLRETESAMKEFREITDMSPQDFFAGENPPVRFGGEKQPSTEEDDIIEDFLSNYKP